MKRIYPLFLMLLVPAVSMAQNINAGLQAYFPFDGNLLDQSSNGYDLTLQTGSISYATVQGTDKALVLNGTSGVASLGHVDNSAFQQEAVSVWFKTTSASVNMQTIVQGAVMGFGIYIQPGTGHLMGFFDGSSVGAYISQDPINDGQWHHVVTQTNGSTTYMYLDGVLDGTLNEPLWVGNGGSDNQLYLGKSNQNAYPYTGAVNGLRIYNRVLTLCEIAELYGRGTDTPIARYPFDGSAQDVSVNGYDMHLLQGTLAYGPFVGGSNDALLLDGNTVLRSEPIDNSVFTQTSLSVWFKTSDVSTDNAYKLVVQGAFLGFGLFIESSSGKLLGFMDGSIVNGYLSSMPLNDGDWHHVVLQSNGQTTSMYIDGMFDGQISEPMYVGNGQPNNQIHVGRTNQLTYPFVGSLNELRLYDHLLSECDIVSLAKPNNNLSVSKPGVSDLAVDMVAFPNPSEDVFIINWGPVSQSGTLEIRDMQGKIIRRINVAGTSAQVNLGTEASGVYFVQLISATSRQTLKIIKK